MDNVNLGDFNMKVKRIEKKVLTVSQMFKGAITNSFSLNNH